MALLLQLPGELLELILNELPPQDLLVCQRVCSAFAEIIMGNVGCQYKTELFAASMVDGDRSLLSTKDKLERLKELQLAWRAPRFRSVYTVSCRNNRHKLLAGDTVVQWTAETDMTFIQPPSRLRRVQEQSWTLKSTDLGFPISLLDGDIAQDLLVAIELVEENEDNFRGAIHLLSFSSIEPHPLARLPILQCDSNLRTDHFLIGSCLCISFDWVLWQDASTDDLGRPRSHFRIWNWKSGKLVWDLHAHALMDCCPTSFAFLDEQHIMFSVIHDRDVSLRVCQIDAVSTISDHMTLSEGFRCSLELPQVTDMCYVSDLRLKSQRGVSHIPYARPGASFSMAPGHSLFVVALGITRGHRHRGNAFFDLFVPASTVHSCLKKSQENVGARTYLWEEWGPAQTRMLRPLGRSWGACGSTMGWRVLLNGAVSGTHMSYGVYNFSPLMVGREQVQIATDSNSESSEETRIVSEPTVLSMPRYFKATICTSLPYSISRIRVPNPPGAVGEDLEMSTEALLWEDGLSTVDYNGEQITYRFFTF